MTPEQWIGVITTMAAALGLREALPGAVRHITGRAGRARDELETARRRARILTEYASHLRGLMLEWGIPHNELPPWPPDL